MATKGKVGNEFENAFGDVFGFANAFGPGRNEIKVATNADLPRFQERVAFRRGVPFNEGRNYHLNYVYDAAGQRVVAD